MDRGIRHDGSDGNLSLKVKDKEGLCHGIKLAEGEEQPGS